MLDRLYRSVLFRTIAAFVLSAVVLTSCNSAIEEGTKLHAQKQQPKTIESAEPTLAQTQTIVLEKLSRHESSRVMADGVNSLTIKLKAAYQRGIDKAALKKAAETEDILAFYKVLGISEQEANEIGVKIAAAGQSFRNSLSDEEVKAFDALGSSCTTCTVKNSLVKLANNTEAIPQMQFIAINSSKGGAILQDNLCCGFLCFSLGFAASFLSPFFGALVTAACMWDCVANPQNYCGR